MKAVLFHPAGVLINQVTPTKTAVERFILDVANWDRVRTVRGPSARLLAHDETAIRLLEGGDYPALPHVKKLLEDVGLHKVYTPKSVSAMLTRLVNQLSSVQEYTNIVFPLMDAESEPLQKRFAHDACPDWGQDLLCESLAMLFLHEEASQKGNIEQAEKSGVQAIVAHPTMATAFESAADELKIADVDWNITSEPVYNYPLQAKLSVRYDRSVGPTCCHLDATQIWRDANSNDDVMFAIRVKARAAVGSKSGHTNYCCRAAVAGPDFWASLNEWEAAGDGKHGSAVLSTAAQVLAAEPGHEPGRPFRVSKDANAKQRTRERDKAKAYRVHVTKAGVGLRLMYWRLPDGTIELANVGSKAELHIAGA